METKGQKDLVKKLEKKTLKKDIDIKDVEKANQKEWTYKTLNGKVLKFRPYFQVAEGGNDIFCNTIRIRADVDGKRQEWLMDYNLLLQLCTAVGNEEHRRKLAGMHLKQVRRLPYDVQFSLTKEEKELGVCQRRIEITIDELIASFAQHEAVKWNIKQQKR